MAQTVSKIILSGSTNGLPIEVTGTATAGAVTVHTAVSGTTSYDEVWVWAHNVDADGEKRTVTVELGQATGPIKCDVPASQGSVLVVPGLPFRNSLVVEAFADEASDVFLTGYVLRVTES